MNPDLDDDPEIDGLLDVSDYFALRRVENETDMELVHRVEIATIKKLVVLLRQSRATVAMANYLETLL